MYNFASLCEAEQEMFAPATHSKKRAREQATSEFEGPSKRTRRSNTHNYREDDEEDDDDLLEENSNKDEIIAALDAHKEKETNSTTITAAQVQQYDHLDCFSNWSLVLKIGVLKFVKSCNFNKALQLVSQCIIFY